MNEPTGIPPMPTMPGQLAALADEFAERAHNVALDHSTGRSEHDWCIPLDDLPELVKRLENVEV